MRISFLFIFCLISLLSFGQKEFKGGIIAGAVSSQISGDGLGGWDKFGMTAGAWVNVPLTEKAGVTVAMKFINKGSRTKLDTLTRNMFAYRLNYIDVPILFSYTPSTKKDKMRISYNIGPYAGVLLKQDILSNKAKYDVPNPQFLNYDIGAQVGVSFWFTNHFFVDYALSSSILPTRPNPSQTNKYSYYEKGNYNQTMQLAIGIRFGGKSDTPQ